MRILSGEGVMGTHLRILRWNEEDSEWRRGTLIDERAPTATQIQNTILLILCTYPNSFWTCHIKTRTIYILYPRIFFVSIRLGCDFVI